MANELTFPHGMPVTLQFEAANPNAGATTDFVQGQGNTGFVVPAGYAFHAVCVSAASNADLTAGTATIKVTDSGDELTSGPTAVLSDTVQRASGVMRVGAQPIAAGHIVGVSVTTDAGYLPITADLDAVLVGILLPA